MRKVLIFLLALQVVSAGYLPAELIKLGNMYRHYMDHRAGGSDMSLVHFVRLHYFDPKHQASDPLTHETLPLQLATGHLLTIVFHSPAEPIHILSYTHNNSIPFALPPSTTLTDGNRGVVFQPPRHA